MRVNILSFVLLSGSLLPALLPARADAKAIEEIQLSADENDLVISVMADEPLRTPTIRTGSGVVRVRFYDVQAPTPSKVSGDGTALRQVDLVRGSDGTAALAVLLGDHTKLAPADVRVEPDGDVTNLRIARGLLPPLAQSANIATAAPSRATPAPQPVAQPAPQPAPVERTAQVASTPTFGKPSKADAEQTQKLTGGDPSSPVVPVLITATVMLALAYVGLQLVLKKRRNFGTDIPIIDVVAHQRLGPKHQLVIVRAFDRDYLLSIQGGQTTVVARSSRKKAALEAAAAVAAATGESSSARRADLTSELRNSSRDFEEDDEPTFGGELFKHALEQRERARESTLSASQAIERARTQSQAASLSRDTQSSSQRARAAVASLVGSDLTLESPFSFPPERAQSERTERPQVERAERPQMERAERPQVERPERAHSERVRISEPRSDFAAHLELDRGNASGDDGRILGNDTSRILSKESARPRPRTVSERVLASDPLVGGENELSGESKISDSVSGLLRLRKQAGR